MSSSPWQTARHRIRLTIDDYTPRGRTRAELPPPESCSQRRVTGVKCGVMNRCGGRLIGSLAAVMAILAHPAAGQIPVFRTTVDLVNMGVTVIDKKGQLISGIEG